MEIVNNEKKLKEYKKNFHPKFPKEIRKIKKALLQFKSKRYF